GHGGGRHRALVARAGAVGARGGRRGDRLLRRRRGQRGEQRERLPGKGQCFDAPSGSLEGMAYDFDVVSCAGEHDGEVFAVVRLSGDSYPGDKKVTATADDRCYALQDSYAMDGWAVPDDVDIYYVTPTAESWSLGDREITCAFGNKDEEASLPGGSLRNDATTLDADQVAYLKAAHVLNRGAGLGARRAVRRGRPAGAPGLGGPGLDRAHPPGRPAGSPPVAECLRETGRGPGQGPAGGAEAVGEGGRGLRRRRVLRVLRQGRRAHRPPSVGHRPQGSGARHDPAAVRRERQRQGRRGEAIPVWRCDGLYSGEKLPG
ncbi:septum formation family protein, partial [Streptomyces sp. L7]